MSEFDPARALREELMALNDLQKALQRRVTAAQEAMSRAESELYDIGKIKGYVATQIEQAQAKLRELEEQK